MIILGIDGGGTKTHALALDDQGRTIGVGVSGPSNYHVVGLSTALKQFADAAAQALGDRQADFTVGCLAACDAPRDEKILTSEILKLGFTREVKCFNDAFAPLRAGSRHPYGVAVICGTGYNACGIAPDGRRAQLNSLGPLTGDWGGGYDVAEAAIGAAFRAEDLRGEPTILVDVVRSYFNVPSLSDLADQIVGSDLDRYHIGRMSAKVFEAADAGDAVARSIIIRLADEMFLGASAMIKQLGLQTLDLDVTLSGGLTRGKGPLLLDTISARLAELYPLAKLQQVKVPPVVGAAMLAYDAMNITVSPVVPPIPDYL
jgi:N-acetylglucosamine kinase-like BadF-type ATPase